MLKARATGFQTVALRQAETWLHYMTKYLKAMRMLRSQCVLQPQAQERGTDTQCTHLAHSTGSQKALCPDLGTQGSVWFVHPILILTELGVTGTLA